MATPKPNPTQQNAYLLIKGILATWGLQELAPEVLKWVQQGYDQNAINYQLQQTQAYKRRFSGNDLRVKNGLAPLSPGEYLSTEAAYRAVFASAGLPKNFYDQPSDYANLIGANISPAEAQTRAQSAAAFVQSKDPNVRLALKTYHGIDDAHLVAHYLDPTVAENLLQRQSNEALIGAAALDQGLKLTDLGRADQYLDMGFDAATAQQAYQRIGQEFPTLTKLGDLYDNAFAQSDEEDAVIGGLASANRKRQGLIQSESDTFGGSSGGGQNTLAVAPTGSY